MLGWAMATCAVPPAEFAMVSTRSLLALSFFSPDRLRLFLWSVAVVITNNPSANPTLPEKSGIMCPTIVSKSAATSPVIQELVSHRTSWKPGGLSGRPPDAKLPNSHISLTSLQRLGYLTATTAWYVTGLTLELEGSIRPHEWTLLTPAVSELSVAWMSPAMGKRVVAC